MSVEVGSSKLDIGLSSSDKAIESDTTVLVPVPLNPSSSSHTVLRALHDLKEECSLDKDTLFMFRDRFQFPDETRIHLPYLGEKALLGTYFMQLANPLTKCILLVFG